MGARRPKDYPKGDRQLASEDWKRRVKAKLVANATLASRDPELQPGSYSELSRAVGCDKSTIQDLLGLEDGDVSFSDEKQTKPTTRHSAMVAPISRVLDEYTETEDERALAAAPRPIKETLARLAIGIARIDDERERALLVEVVEAWSDLDQAQRTAIANVAETFRRQRQSGSSTEN